MKTKLKVIFILFAITFIFVGFQNASSSDAPNCNIKLSDLNFMGHQFKGNSKCVKASTDQEAFRACSPLPAVNPANPNYGTNVSGAKFDYNPDGYYYCVQPLRENSKKWMCSEAKGAHPEIVIQWRNYDTKGYTDGECACGASSSTDARALSLQKCTSERLETLIAQAARTEPQKIEPVASLTTANGVPAATVDPNAELRKIVDDEVLNAQRCERDADTAKNNCREISKDNEVSQMTGDMVGVAGNTYTAMKTGSGSQQECFKAGVVSMGAREAMGAMQETCESEAKNCETSCGKSRYRDYIKKITGSAGKTEEALRNDAAFGTYFSEKSDFIKSKYDDGKEICQLLNKQKDTFSGLLTGLGSALQNSLRCMCQLSSSGAQNCNNIPSYDACSQIPQPQGCDVYGNLGTCVPGSPGYDARTCSCMQNPASCSNGSGGGPSLFGGNLRNAPSNSGGGGGMNSFAGGGVKGGGKFDLSGGGGGEGSTANIAANSSFKGGAAGSAGQGVSGGGGGGNGPADQPAGAAPEGDKSGLNGLFNSAKTFAGSIFGAGGNKKTTTAKPNGNNKDDDMNKFRPRGIASTKSGFGTKNMDIWKLINMCANAETCKSNENNYIVGP